MTPCICVSLCVCAEGGVRGGLRARVVWQDPGSRMQNPVQCKCVNLQFRHRAQPGNKTIKTICNFDMFIRCSLSAFWFGAKGRTGRAGKWPKGNCS